MCRAAVLKASPKNNSFFVGGGGACIDDLHSLHCITKTPLLFIAFLYKASLSHLIQSSTKLSPWNSESLLKWGNFEKGVDIILTGAYSLCRGIGMGLIPCFSCLRTKGTQCAYVSITIIHVKPGAAVFPAVGLLSDVGIIAETQWGISENESTWDFLFNYTQGWLSGFFF